MSEDHREPRYDESGKLIGWRVLTPFAKGYSDWTADGKPATREGPIQSFEGPNGGVGLTVHFAGWSGVEDDWAWIELVFREPGKPDRRRRFNYATPAELGALRDLKAARAELDDAKP